jgi:hypothetical protein
MGNAGNSLTVTAEMGDGKILIGTTGADPAPASLSGASNEIDIVEAAGSLTVGIVTSPTLEVSNMTGSLALADGTVTASVPTEYDTAANISSGLTEDELGGKWFFVITTSGTITLPAISESGHSMCFFNVEGTALTINPDDLDQIRLDGVLDATPGDSITGPGAAGAYICMIGRDNGAADEWITLGRSGAWTAN